MNLTTIERVKAMANKTGAQDDSDLLSDISAASAMMAKYMSRSVQVVSMTESRWGNPSGILFLKNSPIRSIDSVTVADGSGGRFALSASDYWTEDDNEVHIKRSIPSRSAINIAYTGGMAYSTDVSVETVASSTGTPSGSFTTSAGASGEVVAVDLIAKTISIKCHFGGFASGDTLTGSAWSVVIGDTIRESVLSNYPDLAKACDQQAVYMHQRRNSLGRSSVTSGGNTTFIGDYDLLPGVKRVLELYDPQILA